MRSGTVWPAVLACALALALSATSAGPSVATTIAATQAPPFYPDDADYDRRVPTLEEVVGHESGERITSHAEMERYLEALAASSPKVELVQYGETWEGRALYYLVIASEDNHRRMETIRQGIRALADPRGLGASEAERLFAELPVIVWLSHSVHGNEISSTDAALLTAYHLAAARDRLTRHILEQAVVIIDPLQNPDGRDRFVYGYRQRKARWPDANPDSAELDEPWPGGRTNHYLFDLNRDWFAQTQIESQARVEAYLDWRPQVFADLHEMGSNGTYYFPPQATPRNPNQQVSIMERIEVIGRNNARWFDRMGFDYFNREVYDSFYPGYGASWPMYHGAMGMTFEQASARGLRRERSDETVMHYRDGVHHHFIASVGTLEASAENREDFLRHFYDFHREAIAQGESDTLREVLIEPGRDPNRARRLVSLLMSQGVEVDRAEASFSNDTAVDYYGEARPSHEFPAGTFRISLAQPKKHLIKTLMAPEVPMEEDFVREQIRRYGLRQRDQIYDITGWSLPLIFGVEAAVAERVSRGEFVRVASPPAAVAGVDLEPSRPATVAYLLPWGTLSAAKALALLQREGFRVHSAGGSFSIGGREYPPGSLILKVHENATSPGSHNSGAVRSPEGLHRRVREIQSATGADVYATDSSWVEDGINFGSNQVRYLPQPKIALVYDAPTSAYSVGPARYLLERVYEYPVTVVPAGDLAGADLDRFNVLILPSAFGGAYSRVLGESGIGRIKDWVADGGTLVALGAATSWLTEEKVGLLRSERRNKKNEGGAEEPEPSSGAGSLPEGSPRMTFLPEEERPAQVPGAILGVRLDPEHWLAFGYGDHTDVLASSASFFEPLTLDQGTNVGVYLDAERVLVSGFVWDAERELLAGTPYLMHSRHGRGDVVAFVEDPNFRAYLDGLNLLFLNALFFGPGY